MQSFPETEFLSHQEAFSMETNPNPASSSTRKAAAIKTAAMPFD
jgi:hypothetical protein